MAENSGTTTGKGLGKILQKSVTRTKEKVLQNLGKADKTRDDDFEQHVQNFCDQQVTVEKLQKEFKHYTACVKEMSVASYNMFKTIKETYEINWTGYTEVTSSVEQMSSLWEDYMVKLTEQVNNPLTNYLNSFQDVKKQIAKRGRKLTDYDSARHNHESLGASKRHDEAKITKALDELNEARQVYENINARLHDELPGFHAGRVGFLASLFNAMFTAEAVFQHESAKLKDVMAKVTHKLGEESNCENSGTRKFGIPITRSNSDNDNQKKINNNIKSGPVSKRNSAAASNKPVPSPRCVSSSGDQLKNSSSASATNKMEQSPVHSSSQWYQEAETSSASQTRTSVNNEYAAINSQDVANVNGHYSLIKPTEDVYRVPTSNQLVESLCETEKVLYKVVATHSYVGDDTDELSFEPGEVINVVPFEDPDDQDEGWLTGIKEATKEKGVFPENFTKRIE